MYTASVRFRGRSFRPSEWRGPKRLRLRPTQSPGANIKKNQRRSRRTAKPVPVTWPVKRATTLVPQGHQEVALRSGMERQRRLPPRSPSSRTQQRVSLRRPAPGRRRECHRRGMMRQRRGECHKRRMAARSSARGSCHRRRRGSMTIRRHHHRPRQGCRSARYRIQGMWLHHWFNTRRVRVETTRLPMRLSMAARTSAPG